MTDSVRLYRSASESNDMAGVVDCLDDEVELFSPLSGRMVFRGKDDIGVLLGAVYGSISDLEWRWEVSDPNTRVLYGETRIGPLKMTDAMVLELTEQGKIRVIRPHLRPWLAVTVLGAVLGAKLGRYPGIMWRAWRAGG